MFEFLLSEEKKMRRHAANWLEVAERVQNFRRDLLSAAQLQQLVTAAGELKLRLNEKADASRLKMAIEKLEDVLRTTGGRIYPTSSLVENVEFFLVAAIVILGLRAYFVQPFKIPTNSMWPSYYGMTHELFADGREPGWIERAGRLLAFGATHFAAEATADGEVCVPVVQTAGGDLHVPSSPVTARTAGIFPTVRREYVFSINGTPARIQVPGEFDFERVLEDAFAADGQTLSQALQARLRAMSKPPETSIMSVYQGSRRYEQRVSWLPVGKRVKRGDKIVSFDIHTGDLLFVDRFTYNFFPPKVGQGFVFKTGNIDELRSSEGDKYYIKRLVGVPGDKLQLIEPKYIRDGSGDAAAGPAPQLMRNGAPIAGAEAFQSNAERIGLYPGYVNAGRLSVGRVVDVPGNSYFALGDNSPRSLDSRYWGFVPDKDVVGKPLFIYYPLSRRWGVAN